jgi:hypothetical protein
MSLMDPGSSAVKEPSGREKFMDFLQEVKIELVGAKEEFEVRGTPGGGLVLMCVCVCVCVCLSVCLSICLSVRLSICLSVRLSVCRRVDVSMCLCVSMYHIQLHVRERDHLHHHHNHTRSIPLQELRPDEAKRLMKEMDPPGAEKAFFALGCCESHERTVGSWSASQLLLLIRYAMCGEEWVHTYTPISPVFRHPNPRQTGARRRPSAVPRASSPLAWASWCVRAFGFDAFVLSAQPSSHRT